MRKDVHVTTRAVGGRPAAIGGQAVHGSYTDGEATDDLGLKVGDTVSVVIKSSDIMIGK